MVKQSRQNVQQFTIILLTMIFFGSAYADELITGAITNTIQIGTVDHPTIDGGFVNATDSPRENSLHKTLTPAKLTSKPKINDAWASSKQVQRMLEAATRDGKLHYVLKKSRTMGLPASVALLPMIESNYSTRAVSNKGATGAWQLMPSTAKEYGLSSEARMDFTASTDTALHLISDLYHQFGNWELAFAAYNAGSQRIKTAIHRNPNAQSIEELQLPLETKVYVNRMITLNNALAGLS